MGTSNESLEAAEARVRELKAQLRQAGNERNALAVMLADNLVRGEEPYSQVLSTYSVTANRVRELQVREDAAQLAVDRARNWEADRNIKVGDVVRHTDSPDDTANACVVVERDARNGAGYVKVIGPGAEGIGTEVIEGHFVGDLVPAKATLSLTVEMEADEYLE